jgi:hypothetical protein
LTRKNLVARRFLPERGFRTVEREQAQAVIELSRRKLLAEYEAAA